MRLSLAALAEWAQGRLVGVESDLEVDGASVDSRTIRDGELFVALRGENFDGHEYIRDAIIKGARACVTESEEALRGGPGIVVDDSLAALGRMAHQARWSGHLIPWVGITGSNGKTTTRELTAAILRTRGPVASSPGNYNNVVGLPLTILNAAEDTWVGVAEMGTSAPGEIGRLRDILTPTVAVVTGTAAAHLQGLGSVNEVAHEKASIFESLPHDGVAIYPCNDPRADILASHIVGNCATFSIDSDADLVVENIHATGKGLKFAVRGVPFELKLLGVHNAANTLAALLVAEHMGIGLEEAAAALKDVSAVPGRTERIETPYLTIINDAYNANPRSFRAAVRTLSLVEATRHIVIVGDMLELGESTVELHKQLGRWLNRQNIDILLAVGSDVLHLAEVSAGMTAGCVVRHFTNTHALSVALAGILNEGDAVLVKGSRSMRLERIVETLMNFEAS